MAGVEAASFPEPEKMESLASGRILSHTQEVLPGMWTRKRLCPDEFPFDTVRNDIFFDVELPVLAAARL